MLKSCDEGVASTHCDEGVAATSESGIRVFRFFLASP